MEERSLASRSQPCWCPYW